MKRLYSIIIIIINFLVVAGNIKKNSTATPGCKLYLTKPLGIGVLTTAEKKGLLKTQHVGRAADIMCQLNTMGSKIGLIEGVKAMTDVTGFGLLGHLLEMCEGSQVLGHLHFDHIPVVEGLHDYIQNGCCPGGTTRNYESYGHKVLSLNERPLDQFEKGLLCDPQTSGGLLIAVEEGESENQLLDECKRSGLGTLKPIGILESIERAPKDGIFVVVE